MLKGLTRNRLRLYSAHNCQDAELEAGTSLAEFRTDEGFVFYVVKRNYLVFLSLILF